MKVIIALLMLLVAHDIHAADSSESSVDSSDSSSSNEDETVTMSYCIGEEEGQTAPNRDDAGKCVDAHFLRKSGNITVRGTQSVMSGQFPRHPGLNQYTAADRVGSHVVSVRIHCTEKWRTSFHTDVLSKSVSNGFYISLEVNSLKEATSSGEYIKTKGHAYNTFSNRKFHFSDVHVGSYRGLGVKYLSFESTLDNLSNLKVKLYHVTEDGVIINGDEMIDIVQGSVKIDVDISNWQFCDALACKHGKNYKVGDYLDMELTVKGIGAAVQEDNGENNGVRFNVGSGKLIFSRKVQVDGKEHFSTMPTGYPIYTRHGTKDVFKLRFPKFSSRISYDPTLIN